MRQRIDNRLIRGHLAVENPQRIGLRASLAVAAQRRNILAQCRHQRGAERGSARRTPDRVDDQLSLLDPELADQRAGHFDDFRVDRRVGHTEHLDVELMKLAISPLLRTLISKHGAEAVELGHGQFLLQRVLDERPGHARRNFRPQGDPLTAFIGKRVHLLLYDVGRLARSLPRTTPHAR